VKFGVDLRSRGQRAQGGATAFRVTVQLIDAELTGTFGPNAYDGELADIFTIQTR